MTIFRPFALMLAIFFITLVAAHSATADEPAKKPIPAGIDKLLETWDAKCEVDDAAIKASIPKSTSAAQMPAALKTAPRDTAAKFHVSIEFERGGNCTITTTGVAAKPKVEVEKWSSLGEDGPTLNIRLSDAAGKNQDIAIKFDAIDRVVMPLPGAAAALPFKTPATFSRVEPVDAYGPLPRAPGTSVHDQAIKWLRDNNAFGPDAKFLAGVIKDIDAATLNGKDFSFRLGRKLLRYEQATEIVCYADRFFCIPFTDDQAKEIGLKDYTLVTAILDRHGERSHTKDGVASLNNPFLDGGGIWDLSKPLTGKIMVRSGMALQGDFGVRFGLIDAVTPSAVISYLKTKTSKEGTMQKLKFDASPQVEANGVQVVMVDLCENLDNHFFAVSEPMAIILETKSAGGKAKK